MSKVSMYSQYGGFKEQYCRRSIDSAYQFNMFASFIDTLNGKVFNSTKFSWKAYYVMADDDDEKSSWQWGKTLTRMW